MVAFWIGILFTYLLMVFSWQRVREMLSAFSWRIFMTIALECIAYAFARIYYWSTAGAWA